MEFEVTSSVLLSLFFVAIIAGCIDTIAGGGGLLTIPSLMWVGLPPVAALATAKLQSSGGSFFASLYFVRKKLVKLRHFKIPILCSFVGSMLGTITVQYIDPDYLMIIIPFVIMLVGFYFLLSKRITEEEGKERLSILPLSISFLLIIGYYDGFAGPGTGSFFLLALISLSGFNVIKATAHAKVLNFSTNIGSLIFFIIGGHIVWVIGIVMLFGQAIGANIGGRIVINNGPAIIRPIIIIVSFTLSGKLIFDQLI